MSPTPVWMLQQLVESRQQELRNAATGTPHRRRARKARRRWTGWFDRVVPSDAGSRRVRFPRQLGTQV
jgi:hypothetical protein